jgi:uncharacterized membrane protein
MTTATPPLADLASTKVLAATSARHSAAPKKAYSRVMQLDVVRGIAILLVIDHHAIMLGGWEWTFSLS